MALDDGFPLRQVCGGQVETQLTCDDVIEPLLIHHCRNLVEIIDIVGRDDGSLLDVRKQRDFLALLVGQRLLRSAHENVRLNTDRTQFLDRVLRRFGFDFRRRRDVRHQRQMHVHDAVVAEFDAHLANRFEKRQRFDIADRATDLDETNVSIPCTTLDAFLDLIGDMRNHLHRSAQIIAASFFGNDALVDAAGREVAVAARGRADETLVMPQIEIGLGAVVGDEHLTVLEGAHRAGVHIEIGVQLDHAD